ncbi:hypothetical protein D3C86_1587420 [compost metagenome]
MPAGIRLGMSSTDPTFALTVLASSRAGSLPQGIGVEHKNSVHRRPNVGAGLLAKGPAQTPRDPELPPHPRLQTQMRPLPRRKAQAIGTPARRFHTDKFGYLVPGHAEQRT